MFLCTSWNMRWPKCRNSSFAVAGYSQLFLPRERLAAVEDVRSHFFRFSGLDNVLSPLFYFLVQEEAEMAGGLCSSLTSPFNWVFYLGSLLPGLAKVTLLSVSWVTLFKNFHFWTKSKKCQLECGIKSFCSSVFACCSFGLKLHSIFSLLTGSTYDPYFHLAILVWIAAPAVHVDIRYICFPLNSCKNREVNWTVISSSVDATLFLPVLWIIL